MFRNLSSQLAAAAAGGNGEKKSMSPTLRSDIYTAVDKTKSWLAGNGKGGSGQAGDGVSYANILSIVQKHFPDAKLGLEGVGQTESEVSVVVSGVTNMVLEMSKWEAMAGGMAMRTWTDALVNAYGMIPGEPGQGPDGRRKESLARGITRGINNTDVGLMTKDFTAKIQIISSLKSLSSRLFGAGSEEARRTEAAFSSKFI
ncbi:hypothetical protein K435DRAFT_830393 [Dendrothele bispora CBS 962.96]|uniref:Uncharacterized protein n=1 Tax=Dendrothele bispora (strain CBS 962.96) TaxID=1314807 RepID=A0A4S8LL61_DENBC|nr:hypothetical protein K435DRAFT_830393 [Dendrothele bispora CBS 962.96]